MMPMTMMMIRREVLLSPGRFLRPASNHSLRSLIKSDASSWRLITCCSKSGLSSTSSVLPLFLQNEEYDDTWPKHHTDSNRMAWMVVGGLSVIGLGCLRPRVGRANDSDVQLDQRFCEESVKKLQEAYDSISGTDRFIEGLQILERVLSDAIHNVEEILSNESNF